MVEKEDALRATETLKEWCKGKHCADCVFGDVPSGCIFCECNTPLFWKIPKPSRWSDADVALASALIKNGYEMISSVNNEIFSITGRDVDEIYLRNGTFFKPFKPGEIVMLEDIVKEGEQK